MNQINDIEEIYIDNYKIVYKYLLANSHNKDVAEELTQETFYRAVKNINKFKGDSKISSWLCQIAKNLWLAEIKRNKHFKEIDEKDIVISDYDVLASEDKINLYKKIQQLDTETRDVIYLRLSGELTFKEISEIMNKTESWVRVTFYRGKEKLKLKENIENERKQRL